MANKSKKITRLKRRLRIRKKVRGTPVKPRLTIYRSARHIYAQLIDDVHGKTITGISTLTKSIQEHIAAAKGKGKVELSRLIGKEIARVAREKQIEQVVFDRNGFIYHGRIKAVADGAREGGLKF